MHNKIYQLSDNADFFDAEDYQFDHCDDVDYVDEITDETEKKEALQELAELLPEGMLEIKDDKTLIYHGHCDEFMKGILQELKDKLNSIEVMDKQFTLHIDNFRMDLNNPLPGRSLFVFDSSCEHVEAQKSFAFLMFLMDLPEGATIHVGSIFDYHW